MILKFVLCLLIFSCSNVAKGDGHQCDETVRHLGEDDWQDILKGQWVIKLLVILVVLVPVNKQTVIAFEID